MKEVEELTKQVAQEGRHRKETDVKKRKMPKEEKPEAENMSGCE